MAKKTNAVVGMSPAMDSDWEANSALDTLMRACKIRKDAKLMARVRKLAKEQLKEINEVTDKKY